MLMDGESMEINFVDEKVMEINFINWHSTRDLFDLV